MTSNACPQQFSNADNLGHQLRKSGRSFVGYAESCRRPASGMRIGSLSPQAQPMGQFRHAASKHQPALQRFPSDYRKLPTVSFVSPNMCHDMHDCSIRTGDQWMKKHFRRYARWAPGHNSLLVVTFDENAGGTVQSDTDDHRRRQRAPRRLCRADRPLRLASHDRGRVRAARTRPRQAASPLSKIWTR